MHTIIDDNYIIIKFLILSIYIIIPQAGFSQFFNNEQNPPSIKFEQIHTPNFQIIYPSPMTSEAQRMANTLTAIIDKVSYSLGKYPRKISIILQNQNTLSNGFVQLSPRRAEFYTTPPQEFDFQDWLNSLAVHELRHVVQFDKLTGKLKAPLFEELALTIFGITLPPWFFEGDAVNTETSLTTAGRGKAPDFGLEFKTNILSGIRYSYSKDYLGSFKNNTPGYYELGYNMVAMLRKNQDASIMDKLFTRMSKNPLRPYNLSNSIKKYTGLNTKQLHDSTVKALQQFWQEQQVIAKPITYPLLNNRTTNTPTNYLLPVQLSTTEILCLKYSKAELATFTIIDSSKQELSLIKTGLQYEPNFSYSSGKIVWDEVRSDIRYGKRSFSILNSYDIAKKSYKQLTHKTRLFAPTLSPDGTIVAAVSISQANEVQIVELSASSGKELKRYPSKEFMIQYPSFNQDGSKIIFTAVTQQGKAIYELDRATSTFKKLLDYQKQLISRAVYAKDKILFKAHYNGIDNIYELNPANKAIKQLTSAQFGAFNASYSALSDKVFFNSYQTNGYDIASISYPNTVDIPFKVMNTTFGTEVTKKEADLDVFDSIPQKQYAVKNYSGISNLFYFHSIEPIAEENDYFNDYNFGLKLVSNNKLNTLAFYTGYRFNHALQTSEYLAGFTYKKYFPIFDVSYQNQARLIYLHPNTTTFIPVNWRENTIEASALIPVSFNRLNQSYQTGFKISTSYTARYGVVNAPSSFTNKLNFPMLYQYYFSRNSRLSKQSLAPKWGQNISVSYRHFPFENSFNGDFITLKSNFYFPGLAVNHSLQGSFNYQHSSGVYLGLNDIPTVSGYNNLTNLAAITNTLLLKYRFPLFYPDWEIGPLAYIKRFRGGIFTDFENVQKNASFHPRTYGLELTADMNLLRFYLPDFALSGKLIFVNGIQSQNPILEAGFTYNY